MKKLLSVLLTFVMMFSLASVSAFAAGDDGKITIHNVNTDTHYKIYKLFDLDSWSASKDSFNYQISNKETAGVNSNPWYDFIKLYEGTYFTITEESRTADDTVTYSIKRLDAFDDTRAIDFAKNALEYADDKNITPTATNDTSGTNDHYKLESGDGVFYNLSWGYYLVDTSVGALCALRATSPTADITIKNEMPTLEKMVEEDSIAVSGTPGWFQTNTADIGQIVNFDVTINAKNGAQNYVFHDTMENMTLVDSTLAVYLNSTTNPVDAADYTLNKTPGDGCDFEITFTQAFCDTLKSSDYIFIKYSAVLEETAVIAGAGNKNTAWLTFGDEGADHATEEAITTTYTYGFDIIKTDQAGVPLEGAEFVIYTIDSSDNIKYLTFDSNTKGTYMATGETVTNIDDATRIVVNENTDTTYAGGNYAQGFTIARLDGLDADTYYVKEVVAPQGYNALTTDRAVSISTHTAYSAYDGSGKYTSSEGVHIINNVGAAMPETGGMGTVMFITVGAIVVIGAGVLLVTKKRMSMIED